MHSLEIREKWDKNIKKSYMLKKNNRLAIIYILNKNAGLGLQKRDFYEKKINFVVKPKNSFDENPKYYYYFSSIESDVNIINFIVIIKLEFPSKRRYNKIKYYPWFS